MKNKYSFLLIALFAVSLLAVGCADDGPTSAGKSRRELLIAHPWILQKAVSPTGVDMTDEANEETSMLTFHSDGMLTTIGLFGERDTVNWTLTSNDNVITLSDQSSCEIKTLTEEKLNFVVHLKQGGAIYSDMTFIK